MQRLQRRRMSRISRTLGLAQISLALLSAACASDAVSTTTGEAAPASGAVPSTPVAGSSSQPAAQSGGKAGAESTKAPTEPAQQPKAAGAASTATGAAGATAPASSAGGAGASAEAPEAGAASAAGAGGTASEAPDQPAAGSGGEAGASAAGSGAAGTGPVATPTEEGIDPLNPDWSKRTDLGKGDGTDVVSIGDSWMDYIGGGGGIQAGLDRAGTNYRHYGLSATTLISGQIPGQYTRAKGVNPDIKTVIMTGGGNDVMFSGGCNTAELCEMSVAAIQEALNTLWTEMADDGVKDVIYIQYSEDAGTAPTGTRPKSTKPVPICLSGRILCHTLPTTELVMGQLVDGIHPARAANDRIAMAVLKMMEERKMRR
jgi:hypothetical protein